MIERNNVLNIILWLLSALSNSMSTLVFSYGSNSLAQLRGRVLNNELIGRPAIAIDWSRIFCLQTQHWGGSEEFSAVASLHPLKGSRTLGSVVELSSIEVERLNNYERFYTLTDINVCIGQSEVVEKACAYVANSPTYMCLPSEFYLTAIHCMLRENFPVGPIEINRIRTLVDSSNIDMNDIEYVSSYTHPKIRDLALSSVCVEVNMLKKQPWVMPLTATQIKLELQLVEIYNTLDLIDHLSSPLKIKLVEDILVNSGISERGDDTISLFKLILGI
jgi:hypothetical protein